MALYRVRVSFMSSQGPLNPGTVVEASEGNANHPSNVSNVLVSDGSYCTAVCGGGSDAFCNGIMLTNFGFSIPTGATVVGLVAEVKCHQDGTSSNGATINVIGTTKDASTTYRSYTGFGGAVLPTSDAYVTFGDSATLWGNPGFYGSYTPAEVNSSNFGLRLLTVYNATHDGATYTLFIDHVRFTVYYTLPAVSGFFAFFRETKDRLNKICNPEQLGFPILPQRLPLLNSGLSAKCKIGLDNIRVVQEMSC